ncbi:MAG: redoxin domain-containing protein [Gemmatimonadota bacterium]
MAADPNASSIFPAGTRAPDFTLPSGLGTTVSLKQYRGTPVILAFYPADWSPVCGDELALFNEVLDEFKEHDAQLIGISVDGIFCHMAFAEARKLRFPLLADFEPKGAVSTLYDSYRKDVGYSKRTLFVIDDQGLIAWSYLSPEGSNPGADGILKALDSLKNGAAK